MNLYIFMPVLQLPANFTLVCFWQNAADAPLNPVCIHWAKPWVTRTLILIFMSFGVSNLFTYGQFWYIFLWNSFGHPSSHNHGSVENGSLQGDVPLNHDYGRRGAPPCHPRTWNKHPCHLRHQIPRSPALFALRSLEADFSNGWPHLIEAPTPSS